VKHIKKIIIYLFIIGLFSSNITWAGNGIINDVLDNTQNLVFSTETHDADDHGPSTRAPDSHNTVLHHLIDQHHDDHDCHMSSHLLGLNSTDICIAHFAITQTYSSPDFQFSSQSIAPPNKPPRV